jgi:glucose-6-phosphate isomerase
LAAETLQVMAPAINKTVINDRQTITNYMTEGGAVATTVAITTTITTTTIGVAITAPPKPVLLKIIGVGMGGTILGIALATLILRHYRKQVLHQRQ